MNHCLRLSAAVSLLLFPACKGKGDKATPESQTAQPKEAPTEALATEAPPTEALPKAPETNAPAHDAAPQAHPAAMSAPKQTAYAAKGGALLEVQSDGSHKNLGAFGPVIWCEVDSVANVVWGLGASGLQALDLEDAKLHTLVAGKGIESVEMRFAAGSPVGNADGIESNAALIVNVNETPTAKGEIICDGDRVHYCYDEMEGEDQSTWVLSQDAKDSLSAYNAFKLSDAIFLTSVAARSKTRGTVKAPVLNAPEKPSLTISKDGCHEDPESCGELTYVGGQRFWTVITENDRGDFYYEASQLYDSKNKEFVDFGENKRQAKPFEIASGTDLVVSPDGLFAMTLGGALIDLGKADVVKQFGEDVLPCGWR